MKLYLLVEGISSEMQVYPAWINYFLPTLKHHDNFDTFKHAETGFYLVSGMGYPSIIKHIGNAATDVTDTADVDYFFVILDSDEEAVDARKALIDNTLKQHQFPHRTNIEVVIQKRCFETLLLANRKAIPRQPNTRPLIDYMQYYDVINHDPELMGNYSEDYTHSQFHTEYAIKALREKRIRYTKSNCGDVATAQFIKEIEQRINATGHLASFSTFIHQLKIIGETMS
ncbi:MAG: hypothetical protein ACI8WB_001066 [Phenylobacterium sp.]|jgi:hypothetical protein